MPERLRPMLARARSARDAGDHRGAALGYFQAADKARSVELFGELAHCLVRGSEHALQVDEARLALDAAEEALAVYGKTEIPPDMNYAESARLVALALEGLGQWDQAKAYWEKARPIFDLNGIKPRVEECDDHLGAAH